MGLAALHAAEQQRWLLRIGTKRLSQLRHCRKLTSGWPSEASPSLPMPHPVGERLSRHKTQVGSEERKKCRISSSTLGGMQRRTRRQKEATTTPGSFPPHTEHEQSDQRPRPPKVSTKRFPALPQKPTTRRRTEHWSNHLPREGERDHQG